MQNILVVDPEEQFIDFCRTWLEPEGFQIQPAHTGTEALDRVQSDVFKLVIVSLEMPDIDSLEILRQLEARGLNLPAVVSTGAQELPVQQVAAATQLGAIIFIEKPCAPETLIDGVQQTADQYAPGTVRGNLRDFSLTSLITVNCNEGLSASLILWRNSEQAELFFHKGEIVHAALDGQEGEEAVLEMLAWDEARFVLKRGVEVPERTVYTSWTGLLMTGMQRIDEASFDQEQLEPDSLPSPPPPQEDPLAGMGFDSGPLPTRRRSTFEIDSQTQKETEDHLYQLSAEIGRGVRCILFTHRTGRLLHSLGQIERHRALSLAALVAGSFSAIGEFAELLAEEEESKQFHQSLQEGEDFSFYSAQVGTDWVLSIAFEAVSNLGLVRHLMLRTAETLAELIAQAQPAAEEEHQEIGKIMDETFRQEVSDTLGDLFG